jgi:hypothetical protein
MVTGGVGGTMHTPPPAGHCRPEQQSAVVAHAAPFAEQALMFWQSFVGGTVALEVTLHSRVGEAPVAEQQSSLLEQVAPRLPHGEVTQ